VLTAERATSELALKESYYVPTVALVQDSCDNVLKLLKLYKLEDKLKDRVLPFLQELAVKGFVELKSYDSLCDLAMRCNVAGFLNGLLLALM
jgi:hypothetical protein